MDIRRFHKLLHDSTKALVPFEKTVVCAVSGGADSMAMLHAILKVNEIHDCGWRLCVAHLDHGLPYDSAAVERFVRESAESLALPYFADKADVPALSKQTRMSIEEVGRKVRYEFLNRAAAHFDASIICTAHHADDQAETVLHRIIRGTGLTGLAGIPSERALNGSVRVVRPMLSFGREELRDYLIRRHLPHMEDPTNQDLKAALRNRVRHELLPKLGTEYNPRVVRSLVRLARQAGFAAEALGELAEQTFEQVLESQSDSMITLRAVDVSRLVRGMQAEVVRLTIDRLGCERKSIGTNRIEATIDLIRGTGKKRRIEMAGLIVERRGRFIRFIRQGPLHPDSPECVANLKETPA